MRRLRLTLEEINEDTRTCHRAERVITQRELGQFQSVSGLLNLIIEDLEETLETEIEKSNDTNKQDSGGGIDVSKITTLKVV